jgi:large subunit ribosomal protein L21
MYAIFENGSHQFRVSPGDTIEIDKRPEQPGDEIVFENVLLIAGDSASPRIGTPNVSGARVLAQVVRTDRGRKILIRKFRRRKGYRRKKGHRQSFTTVRITGINV